MAKKKILITQYVTGVGLLALLLVISYMDPYPVQYIREKTFDSYQIFKPRPLPKPENRLVAIVDIDEQSLSELGQWPWSRKIIAQLVANLQTMGAAAIAFDVVFSEPDRLNPAVVAKSLTGIDNDTRNTLLGLQSNDEIFADIIGQASVVLGRAGYWNQLPNQAVTLVKKAIAVRKISINTPEPADFVMNIPTLIGNLPILEENAQGIGIFAFKPLLDGVVRQVPLISQHNSDLYPALSLEAIRVGLQIPTLMVNVSPSGIQGISIAPNSMVPPNGLKVKTDENGQVRPYFGLHDPDLYISASDIFHQRTEQSRIAGKIIFIGSSAAGLLDIRSTPVSSRIPGVEIHAQILENILAIDREKGVLLQANQFLTHSPFVSKGGEIVLMALGGLLMIILSPILGAIRSLILFLILAAVAIGGSWYLFAVNRILVDATYAIFTAFMLYLTLTYLNLAREEKAKQQTRDAFSKYLSPDMVDVVAENPDQLKLGGQKRTMTLLFCDVRGFTTISEQFDAEGLTKLINKLLSPLTDVILRQKGTVDKYMGDCIMAFWNAPLDDPKHAENGCLASLRMLEEMKQLNIRLEKEAREHGEPHIYLKVGLGLNSGECVVGNMGSAQRFDYSVLGDTVNLASRLEGQSKNYGVDIVIGEQTQIRIPTLATIELDIIKVKGKSKAVRIFALLGNAEMAESKEFKLFKEAVNTMLVKWRDQDWIGTGTACETARNLGEAYTINGFFDLYEKRVDDYMVSPPETHWDGVFIATSK